MKLTYKNRKIGFSFGSLIDNKKKTKQTNIKGEKMGGISKLLLCHLSVWIFVKGLSDQLTLTISLLECKNLSDFDWLIWSFTPQSLKYIKLNKSSRRELGVLVSRPKAILHFRLFLLWLLPVMITCSVGPSKMGSVPSDLHSFLLYIEPGYGTNGKQNKQDNKKNF